jgi:hypothetical protein
MNQEFIFNSNIFGYSDATMIFRSSHKVYDTDYKKSSYCEKNTYEENKKSIQVLNLDEKNDDFFPSFEG